MSGNPLIGAVEQRLHESEPRDKCERRCPPELPDQENYRISTAEDVASGSEDAHLFERLFCCQIQSLLHPVALERFELESALREDRLEPQGQIAAKAAILI